MFNWVNGNSAKRKQGSNDIIRVQKSKNRIRLFLAMSQIHSPLHKSESAISSLQLHHVYSQITLEKKCLYIIIWESRHVYTSDCPELPTLRASFSNVKLAEKEHKEMQANFKSSVRLSFGTKPWNWSGIALIQFFWKLMSVKYSEHHSLCLLTRDSLALDSYSFRRRHPKMAIMSGGSKTEGRMTASAGKE